MQVNIRVPQVINSIYARALKACPWVGLLWAAALRALERTGAPEEDHVGMYGRALMSGWLQNPDDYLEVRMGCRRLGSGGPGPVSRDEQAPAFVQVMLARLDRIRRRGPDGLQQLRETFEHAAETLRQLFPDFFDPRLRLVSYWARCELSIAKDTAAARAVWESALKNLPGRYDVTWLAYVEMERGQGNIKEARQVFRRGYSRRLESGGQVALCEAWLRFEREEGSAEDLFQAQIKVDPILVEAQAQATAAVNAEAARCANARGACPWAIAGLSEPLVAGCRRAAVAAEKAPKLSKEEMIKLRREKDPNFGKGKRKRGAATPAAAAAAAAEEEEGGAAAAKRARTAVEDDAAADEDPQQLQHEGEGPTVVNPAAKALGAQGKKPHQGKQPSAAAKAPAPAAATAGGHPAEAHEGHGDEAAPKPLYTDKHTAFVKNLAFSVSESELSEFFSACCGTEAVRRASLVRDKASGASRGFGYVELGSKEALDRALQELNGKQLAVSPCPS